MQAPELDRAERRAARAAPYPELVPLGPVLAGTPDLAGDVAALEASLLGRAAQLRTRALALQGDPVIDPQTRLRLLRGQAR